MHDSTMMVVVKQCAQCQRSFARPHAYSAKQWAQRRFCSQSCSGTGTQRGRKHSPETCAKRSAALAGRTLSPKHSANISAAKTGKKRPPFSPEWRENIGAGLIGKKHTPERRAKTSGPNSSSWRGGITPLNEKIRHSTEYAEWRTSVFERDNYTCVHCGIRGVKLHADHILRFSEYPHLRLELTNGRTLCVPCHRKTPTYGSRKAVA